MCGQLFLNLLHGKISNKEQFEMIHDYPTPKEAAEAAIKDQRTTGPPVRPATNSEMQPMIP